MSNPDSIALVSDELPGLSDEDVNILYAITLRASESDDPPFRALFAAYDAVLADNDIAAEHDQVYFRYLLRLGEGCRSNARLVTRLKRLLERLDIHIVVAEEEGDEDNNGEEDYTSEDEIDARPAVRDAPYRQESGHRRRSSFNDTGLEETWVSGGRLDSEESPGFRGRVTANGANGIRKPASRATSESTDAIGRPLTSALIAQRLNRGRTGGGHGYANGTRARSLSAQSNHLYPSEPALKDRRGRPARHAPQPAAPRQRHNRSARYAPEPASNYESEHAPHATRRTRKPAPKSREVHAQPDYTQQSDTGYGAPSSLDPDDSVYISSSPPPVPSPRPAPVPAEVPPPPLYLPEPLPVSVEQLVANADAFVDTTSFRAARRLFHHWHDQTIRSRQSHHDMYQIASNYDSQTLLSQAFSTWRSTLASHRQAAEMDRYFGEFERRATRARDLFLLNKAFTHWAQSASDEVARTNVARRHILRTRYFNAWKDITAVNELKSRRLGLRKWFSTWRAKAARKAIEGERALAIHEEKLVERTYWKWFWTFCERKAPVWQDARLKKSTLTKITNRALQVQQLNVIANDMRNYHLIRRALSALAVQSRANANIEAQASQYRRTRLLSLAFGPLRKHSQLAPRWRRFEQESSFRLAGKTMSTWSLNTTLARQAEQTNQQRLLRNALTEWNDKLRTKAITTMMDERIKAETWYKWILLERLALFQRITGYKLLERTMQTLSIRLTEQRFRLGEAEDIFHQHQRRRLLASAMLKMNRRSRNEEHLERLALEFRNERALQPILPTWRRKHEHIQQLDRWSKDARFYCLTHSAIGRWKEAAANAKRVKRREAYSTVRRRAKINLVRNCFQHWRERSGVVSEIKAQAEERYQIRLFAIGTAAFDQWRQMSTHNAELNLQSEDIYLRGLFEHAVSRLTVKGHLILQNHAEAESYVTQTVHLAVQSEMMKRLKWQLFCLKRNRENAVALKERNASQHRRNMLRYWAEQANQRRKNKVAAAAALDPESPSKPEPNLFSSLRLPSARKPPLRRPATTSQLPDRRGDDTDVSEDEEMDFGASTTRQAEEWTQYDFLRDLNTNNLPTLNEESEPPSNKQDQSYQYPAFGTPLPGYLRTPSKRTARQRSRFKTLGLSAPRPASAFASFPVSNRGHEEDDEDDEVTQKAIIASTTPAPLRPGDTGLGDMSTLTPQVTPFDRKMRAGGFGSTVRPVPSFTPATRPRVRPAAGTVYTPGLSRSRFGRSILGGGAGGGATGRSVRFFDGVGGGGSSLNGDTPGGGVELGLPGPQPREKSS